MRDPQRFIDDKDQPEWRRLLLAAKDDGPAPPREMKQRVQAAVLLHMRERDEVRQSGVRRIAEIIPIRPAAEEDEDKPIANRPRETTKSRPNRILAFLALAAAFAIVGLMRHRMVVATNRETNQHRNDVQTEQSPLMVPSHVVKASGHEKPLPSESPAFPDYEEMDEHRESITVTEEPTPAAEKESVTEAEEIGPPREVRLTLKNRAHRNGVPSILIRSACSDPNDWLRNTEIDYPADAYDRGTSGTMNVVCNLNPNGSFSGCVGQRPPGFTASDIGKVIVTMNSWTLAQSMMNSAQRTRRCKIDVTFDIGKNANGPEPAHK